MRKKETKKERTNGETNRKGWGQKVKLGRLKERIGTQRYKKKTVGRKKVERMKK